MGEQERRVALQRLDALRASGTITTDDYIQLVAGLGAGASASAPTAPSGPTNRRRSTAPGSPGLLGNAAAIAGGVAVGSVAGRLIGDRLSESNDPTGYEFTATTRTYEDADGVVTTEYTEDVDLDDDGGGFDFADFGV